MKTISTLSFCIGLAAFFVSCGHKEDGKATRADQSTEIIPVKVIPVSSQKSSEDIFATGLLTTENEAIYSFKIGGVVSKVLVEEGQFFKKGQVLALLNTTEITA